MATCSWVYFPGKKLGGATLDAQGACYLYNGSLLEC